MSKLEKKKIEGTIKAIKLSVPGVKRCGNFIAGQIYRVPEQVSADEARRLVDNKAFSIVEG